MRPRVQTASATTACRMPLRRTEMLHAHVQERTHPLLHALVCIPSLRRLGIQLEQVELWPPAEARAADWHTCKHTSCAVWCDQMPHVIADPGANAQALGFRL